MDPKSRQLNSLRAVCRCLGHRPELVEHLQAVIDGTVELDHTLSRSITVELTRIAGQLHGAAQAPGCSIERALLGWIDYLDDLSERSPKPPLDGHSHF